VANKPTLTGLLLKKKQKVENKIAKSSPSSKNNNLFIYKNLRARDLTTNDTIKLTRKDGNCDALQLEAAWRTAGGFGL